MLGDHVQHDHMRRHGRRNQCSTRLALSAKQRSLIMLLTIGKNTPTSLVQYLWILVSYPECPHARTLTLARHLVRWEFHVFDSGIFWGESQTSCRRSSWWTRLRKLEIASGGVVCTRWQLQEKLPTAIGSLTWSCERVRIRLLA